MADAEAPRWSLVRTAVLGVGRPPVEFHLNITMGEVHASTARRVSKDGEPVGMLALAVVPLNGPPEVREGVVVVPEDHRSAAERALELLARYQAVDLGETHSVLSPVPCVGFHCTLATELDHLVGLEIARPYPVMPPVGMSGAGIIANDDFMRRLHERSDGVVMLTEALNARSPVGQFSQFWRLFERGFGKGFRESGPHMAQFLSAGPHHIDESEVQEWIDRRNPAIHANRAATTPTLDRDVQIHVGRMREAAYDVLLNKENWGVADAVRSTKPWQPSVGSAGRTGDIFGVAGKEWKMQTQLLDPFGSFPLLLAGKPGALAPDGLWVDGDVTGLALRRMGDGTLDLK